MFPHNSTRFSPRFSKRSWRTQKTLLRAENFSRLSPIYLFFFFRFFFFVMFNQDFMLVFVSTYFNIVWTGHTSAPLGEKTSTKKRKKQKKTEEKNKEKRKRRRRRNNMRKKAWKNPIFFLHSPRCCFFFKLKKTLVLSSGLKTFPNILLIFIFKPFFSCKKMFYYTTVHRFPSRRNKTQNR